MARDALALLWRVRDTAVTQASLALGLGQGILAEASRQLDDHMSQMRREQSATEPALLEAFAAWLPHARHKADRLRVGLVREQEAVARLQHVLTLRRTEAEVVAKARERAALEARRGESSRAQAVMDEAAGRACRRSPQDETA